MKAMSSHRSYERKAGKKRLTGTVLLIEGSPLRSDERPPRGLDSADGQARPPARRGSEFPDWHERRTREGAGRDDEARF
jgi:hypothetical protein